MSKTVREIAIALGADASSMVKEKQRIRDEFKRQNIKPKSRGIVLLCRIKMQIK
jgi:hypothetical protein